MVDGQNNQDFLLEDYRRRYGVLLGEETTAGETKLFQEFSLDSVREFIKLHEERYPRQKEAFAQFYRKADRRYDEHLLKIKCMVYLLDEPVAEAMTRLMRERKSFTFLVDDEEGSARFKRDSLGKSCIYYKKISQTARYQPPYKTFFHEFGHAIDGLTVGGFSGKDFYSDRFVCVQQAEKKRVVWAGKHKLAMERQVETCRRTIHQWAQWDLENSLLQCVLDLLQGKVAGAHLAEYSGLAADRQLRLLQKVVYDLFLSWDGQERFRTICQALGLAGQKALAGLYLDVKAEMEKGLMTTRGIPALPRDVIGGLTGNQIGGGHSLAYWYRTKGLSRGKRINQVSREAFAGYFEYRVLGLDARVPVIDPGGKLPHMVRALGEMFDQVVF